MRLALELKSKIDALWDKFWSGGLSNPLSYIEQMSYLIFMKRLEDMDVAEQKKAQEKKQPFLSVFSGLLSGMFWSSFHVQNRIFPCRFIGFHQLLYTSLGDLEIVSYIG